MLTHRVMGAASVALLGFTGWAVAAPSSFALALGPAASSRPPAPSTDLSFETLCGAKRFAASAEPSFVTSTSAATTQDETVTVQIELDRAAGKGTPRRVFASADLVVDGGNRVSWTPDYQSVGDLADGKWVVRSREIDTMASGKPNRSPWSVPVRFSVDTMVPPAPTVTVRADGSLQFSAPGAAGFDWSELGPLSAITSGQDVCAAEGGSSGGFLPANHRGTATVVPDLSGPIFIYVEAYNRAGVLSAVTEQIVSLPD